MVAPACKDASPSRSCSGLRGSSGSQWKAGKLQGCTRGVLRMLQLALLRLPGRSSPARGHKALEPAVVQKQEVIRVGARVQVKPSVAEPKHGWGNVTHVSIGIVTMIDGEEARVNFPEFNSWWCKVSELQMAPEASPAAKIVTEEPKLALAGATPIQKLALAHQLFDLPGLTLSKVSDLSDVSTLPSLTEDWGWFSDAFDLHKKLVSPKGQGPEGPSAWSSSSTTPAEEHVAGEPVSLESLAWKLAEAPLNMVSALPNIAEAPLNMVSALPTMSQFLDWFEEEKPKPWWSNAIDESVFESLESLSWQHLLALQVVQQVAEGVADGWPTSGAPPSPHRAAWTADPLGAHGGEAVSFADAPVSARQPENASVTQDLVARSASGVVELSFDFVPRLQARASEVALLPDGRLQLPLLAPDAPSSMNGEHVDVNFAYWMDGGPGVRRVLPAQSFFFAYDDTDTSVTTFGKTYGPQRKPGAPFTMRPFLVVFERTDRPWAANDLLANFEVRYWDYEFGYVTKARTDVGIGLGPRFLGEGRDGELRYAMCWMQTVPLEVVLPKGGGPLQLTSFNGRMLEKPVPLFRMQSGWHDPSSQWYVAPVAPEGHKAPALATFNVSFRSAMKMLSAVLG